MSIRKNIGKKQRFEIFERDGFQCAYCGKQPPQVCLQVDHVEPVSKGGTNDPGNLVTACQGCNAGKGAKKLKDPAENAIDNIRRMQEAMETTTLAKAVNKAAKAREEIRQQITNVIGDILSQDSVKNATITSVINQIEHFGIEEVLKMLDYTYSRLASQGGWCDETKFIKYFSGICRNKKANPDE